MIEVLCSKLSWHYVEIIVVYRYKLVLVYHETRGLAIVHSSMDLNNLKRDLICLIEV